MRQLGAALLAFWYSLILCFSFSGAIKSLSSDLSSEPGEHYVLIGLGWLSATAFAAFLGGMTSRSHPFVLCVFAALPSALLCVFMFWAYDLGGTQLPSLAFGWSPAASAYVGTLFCLTLAAAVGGALSAHSELQSHPPEDRKILGVSPGHWWWLWLPISSWVGIIPGALYLLWLTVATVWHWTIHPSLWFEWRWALYLSFGTLFTYLPYGLLNTGISEAWDSLSFGRERGLSRASVALRFLGWGYGCAVVGGAISMLLGLWILSHLPVVSRSGQPWWVVF